jgi:hypothetical protein
MLCDWPEFLMPGNGSRIVPNWLQKFPFSRSLSLPEPPRRPAAALDAWNSHRFTIVKHSEKNTEFEKSVICRVIGFIINEVKEARQPAHLVSLSCDNYFLCTVQS